MKSIEIENFDLGPLGEYCVTVDYSYKLDGDLRLEKALVYLDSKEIDLIYEFNEWGFENLKEAVQEEIEKQRKIPRHATIGDREVS